MRNGTLPHEMLITLSFISLMTTASSLATAEESWTADDATIVKFEKRNRAPDRVFNYREKNVPPYELPNVLTANDGSRIETEQEWKSVRRPEVLELFRKHVYGRVPENATKGVGFEVIETDAEAMEGKATLVRVRIRFAEGVDDPSMNLVTFIPNEGRGPKPAFLLICNRDASNIDPTRTIKSEFWPAEELVERGYVMAAFVVSDVDPDNYDKFQNGVHGLLDPEGERPRDAWAMLAAWAWGAGRAMDYFETDDRIDEERVAVVGHSRGGKTSLWAGAEDERFALVISNNSGCGGAALSRRRFGETVARINKSFPHWFCEKFNDYNENEAELPVDQHMLVALAAPRLVYVASADEDLWADPRGEFLSCVHASPVYELFGATGLERDEMPALAQSLHAGRIGYHIRPGGHGLTPYDWHRFADFWEKHSPKK